jgi:type I restriction enzyme M protein
MLGAIIGDIVGSRFEWDNIKTKEFDFLTYKCSVTDDSIMSLAVAKAIVQCNGDYSALSKNAVKYMQEIGRPYPFCGYGGMFRQWMYSDDPKPYGSYGNGAAMRVSACGFAATSMDEAIELSRKVTEVTHNHPEGIKGAEATAVAIYMARTGSSILEIRDYINNNYYPMNFTLDGIRDSYSFNETCQDTVPQAIMAFLESENFEDAIRNAISIGGDSDTLAAITGGIAEAYYGIPAEIRKHALTFLDELQLSVLNEFETKFGFTSNKKTENGSRVVKYVPISVNETRRVETTVSEREQSMLDAVNSADSADTSDVEWKKTTSTMLFNHLFEACNILRGPINQDEFKTYVIPLLFFKRVSDTYDEETQIAYEEYGEDVADFDEDEIHKFIIPEGCHWVDVRTQSENVGAAIVNAMIGIERANPDTLSGLFSSFDDANWTDKNKLSDERLKDLIEHMSRLKVGNKNYSADVMGDAYEFLLKKFADLSKKNAGEFYTPRSVVKLLVKILAPKAGETVYDPACGTGGMLIEAIRQMNDEKAAYGRIYGQEKNLATSAIARMNLYLHGALDFKVTQGDTLRSPNYIYRGELKTFDCCIANPPFGLSKWGADQFLTDVYGRNIWGCPTDSNADFAWLQHLVKSMDPKTGRCTVILPQGVLFHGGKEGEIRQKLIESDKLEAVITFVGGLFYGAGVSACTLVLNNNKPAERKGKVILIDGSTLYTAQRAQNIMTDENVEAAYKLYADYQDVIDLAKVVTIEEIAAKDFTLSVNSYIEKTQQEVVDPAVVRQRYFDAVEEVRAAEDSLLELLRKEGLLNE